MRTVELVPEWDTVPFDGGYEGLRTLSDQGFSGAVTAGPTQLFMLNGTVVGVLDGDIEAFEGAGGTARAAPHDALPLLVVMQDSADSPRAQYYTEDTPISEVDRTLEDGNFTGFVELSENVLSGDYYLVYHQGRSMSVAWVGNSKRLVTDEDAFQQADGEVGIYEVMPATIEPVEIPEPQAPSGAEDEGAAAAGASAGGDQSTSREAPEPTDSEVERDADDPSGADTTPTTDDGPSGTEPAEAADATDSGAVSATTADVTERDSGPSGPPGSKAAGASQGTAVDRHRDESDTATETASSEATAREAEPTATEAETTEAAETEAEPTEAAETDAEPTEAAATEAESAAAEPERTETEAKSPATEAEATQAPATDVEPTDQSDGAGSTAPRTEQPGRAQEPTQSGAASIDSDAVGALETRSIPSLDPERSSSTPEEPVTRTPSKSIRSSDSGESTTAQSAPATEGSSTTEPAADESAEPQTEESSGAEPSAELRAELTEREERIAELEEEITDISTENEELTAERDRLLDELEEARAEIQRLEEELAAAGGAAPSGRTLSAAEAIDGTNLFVRYHSKGEATLAKAQDGTADRAAVEENLRLEHHTQFDGDEVVVDGETFEAFLQDSIHYRFVDWLVRNLLYEIRDTGHESAMGVLYDALPDVDRAELNGKVSVTYTENGEEHRSQEQFDVVVRDRMGNPLVVANINDSRQPATDGQMTDIVRNAERVGNASESLAAAFLVTSSFFEPEALETAKEATSSGLFSRDKRKSFVNLSRKGGYHLCLLEARNREFHLAVPEL